jgi:hypothetical protein
LTGQQQPITLLCQARVYKWTFLPDKLIDLHGALTNRTGSRAAWSATMNFIEKF